MRTGRQYGEIVPILRMMIQRMRRSITQARRAMPTAPGTYCDDLPIQNPHLGHLEALENAKIKRNLVRNKIGRAFLGAAMRHEKALALLGLARRLAASAEGMTLDEMAASLGVVRRTAERVRNSLETLFPQMEMLPDGAAKRYRIPKGLDGFFHAPTTEELLELTSAATGLKSAGQIGRAQSIETLELKVRGAMRRAVLHKMLPDVEVLARAEMSMARVGPRPHEDPEALATIRYAIMAARAIRFTYHGGSNPGSSRTVCPYGILFERMNYLVAAELSLDQVRSWRLDRIKVLKLTDEAASAPETFRLEDYANQSFGIYRDNVEAVVLRVLPHGAEDARNWWFHPSQNLSEQADGSIIVQFKTSGMRELAWHLFTWGDKVDILEPARLKIEMLEELRLSCSRHGFPDPTDPVAGQA